jgi:rhodanese-related sulfurtransferase
MHGAAIRITARDCQMFNFLRPNTPRVERIAPTEAVARAARGELTLIDVRELAELKSSGKAKGALHMPLSLVGVKGNPKAPDCPAELSVDKPVAVYCASGGRSGMAAGALLQHGYKTVYNLGGLSDWVAGGGAVERV